MGYQLIETIEVGAGGAASIEFTGIPQDATSLVCIVSSRSSNDSNYLAITFNNDDFVADNYTRRALRGTGSFAESDSSTSSGLALFGTVPSGATANTFSSNSITVSNYTSSAAKSISVDTVGENNGTLAIQSLTAGQWSVASPITICKLWTSGNFVQYSTASLYKITA
tara:strand:+ start:460 stop:963 length:504 start_codon:yes stop_codon:yes gene_type:complete